MIVNKKDITFIDTHPSFKNQFLIKLKGEDSVSELNIECKDKAEYNQVKRIITNDLNSVGDFVIIHDIEHYREVIKSDIKVGKTEQYE